MKEFCICASAPGIDYIFGVVLAHNMRDAWYFFKKRYRKQYKRLRFDHAYLSNGEHFYSKVN